MAKANDKKAAPKAAAKAAPAKAAKAPAKAAPAKAAPKAAPVSRGDVVDIVAAQSGLTRSQAEGAIKAYEGQIQRTLSDGGEVRLAGFGSFKTSHRAARMGRNPQTGEPAPVAARTVVRFVPSAALKGAVDGASAAKAKPAKAPAKAAKAPAKAAKAPAKAAAKAPAKGKKK